MESSKNPISIRIIYWMTNISFWLFVVVFIASFAFNIALQMEWLGGDLQIHTEMPTEVNYREKGSFYFFGREHKVEFVEAMGSVHFIDTDQQLAKWFGGLLLGVVSISLFIFLAFKRFIGNVYRGYIFERFNIRMLRNMSYGLIFFWGFMMLYSRLFYYFIATKIEFEHIKITSNMNSYGFLLAIALFLWVLSHIFMTGVKIQEDQNLTV